MVLDDVADRPGSVVERAAALDAEVLRHRDLHALDVVAVPDRLEEGVDEAEEEHVDDRPLAEVVVDAEDRRLSELRAEIRFSSCAEARSLPKGFSTMTRASSRSPAAPSCSTTFPNRTGGMAR